MKRFALLLSLLFCFAFSTEAFGNQDSVLLQETIERFEKAGGGERHWPELHRDTLDYQLLNFEKMIEMLDKIEPNRLSENDRISYDLLRLIVENRAFRNEFRSYEFPLDSEGGFITGIYYSVSNQQLRSAEEAEKYLEKLRALPHYLDRRIATMREGQNKGKSSPKLIAEKAVKVVNRVLQTPAEDTYFMWPVSSYSAQQADADAPSEAKLKADALKILEDEIFPAYQRLHDFLKNEYLPAAPAKIGISEIRGGKKYYEQRVQFYTTYDISPDAVFETGMKEVKRIRAEMQTIIEELGFEGSYGDFLEFLRTDPQFYAESPEEIMGIAIEITNRTQGIMPTYFGKLPRNPLTVVPVPEAIAEGYTAGRYSGGSIEDHRAGEYWVNTSKLDSRTLYTLPALTLHEGVPGHHTQIMLAAELEDMPEFRRNTYLSAFGEGWALYAEYLGLEAGLYRTPYEHFGRLTYEMWRACRLVVDPGMHYKGWTREEAVEFMASNTALSMVEVNSEIDRYIGWPGQAVSYKMGELKIKELRAEAEQQLGADFDIRAFHDVVLANGSIPMATLERNVGAYIQAVKAAKMVEKQAGEEAEKE